MMIVIIIPSYPESLRVVYNIITSTKLEQSCSKEGSEKSFANHMWSSHMLKEHQEFIHHIIYLTFSCHAVMIAEDR